MTSHGGDGAKRAARVNAKRPGPAAVDARRFAEDFPVGTRLQWPSPPRIRIGSTCHAAPSASGVVAFHIAGSAFVRFGIGFALSEPIQIVDEQLCKEQP